MNNDFTNLGKYHNQWIAIKQGEENEVVGTGKTLEEALENSKKKGVKNPVLTKTPTDYGTLIL